MDKKFLTELGIAEAIAEQVLAEYEKVLGDYVPKADFDKLSAENAESKSSIEKLTADIAKFADTQADNEKLKAELEAAAKEKTELALDYKVRLAIANTANDIDIAAAQIDKSKLKVNEDGSVDGLDEQVKALKESKGFLFKDENKGFLKVGGSGEQTKDGKSEITLAGAINAAVGAQMGR